MDIAHESKNKKEKHSQLPIYDLQIKRAMLHTVQLVDISRS